MPKAVLLSVQPKWCELIASGKKTVEVRKTKPKLPTPFKCYIYESSGNHRVGNENFNVCLKGKGRKKVIGEFVCDTIITDKTFGHDAFFKAAACMSDAEIAAYCVNPEMYGWHISNLIIYDKPKELSEFHPPCNHADYCTECKNYDFNTKDCRQITRPPQSWCYVEVTE